MSAEILKKRGLLVVATTAGWKSGTHKKAHGWWYPVIDQTGTAVDRRWKARDDSQKEIAGKKYVWQGAGKVRPNYYIPAGLNFLPAIKDSANGVILANGEPSVLAFMAAGMNNVFCWFGETSIPKTLISDLQSWGVTKLVYAADKDQAGIKSATKVRDLLKGSGIEYLPRQWPDDFPEKGDANDLWISVEFNPSKFRAAFKALRGLLLPTEKPEPTKPTTDTDRSDVSEDLVSTVVAALHVNLNNIDAGGFVAKAIACPIKTHEHDDKSPAFHWHPTKFFGRCFKCGEDYNTHRIAEALGIDPKTYYQKTLPAKDVPPLAPTKPTTKAKPLRIKTAKQLREAHLKTRNAPGPPRLITGLRCEIPRLNLQIGGFNKGKVITILGLTGTGKTTLAASLAVPLMGQGRGLIVSCETLSDEFYTQMVAYKSRIDAASIDAGGLIEYGCVGGSDIPEPTIREFTPEELRRWDQGSALIDEWMARNDTIVSDQGGLTPEELRTLFEDEGQGIQWAVVDSLNNIRRYGDSSDYEDVTDASTTVAELAQEFQIPIIATAQVGRSTKERKDKKIRIHDGKGSGAIEEKAAILLAIHNQDLLIDQGEMTESDRNLKIPRGHAALFIRKLRNRKIMSAVLAEFVGGTGFYPPASHQGHAIHHNGATARSNVPI